MRGAAHDRKHGANSVRVCMCTRSTMRVHAQVCGVRVRDNRARARDYARSAAKQRCKRARAKRCTKCANDTQCKDVQIRAPHDDAAEAMPVRGAQTIREAAQTFKKRR